MTPSTRSARPDIIKALYGTGFFNDVRVESDGDVLVLSVSERPVIAQLQVNGSKEFPKEQLIKAMKDNGLAESRIFDQGLLDQAVQELKRQYFSKGKYSAEIQTQITRLERNRVAVTLDIVEGVTAKISDIRIVGNKAFSEDTLLEEMSLTPSGFMTWLSRSDRYSKQQLSADLEKIRAFYLNQGYAEFNIESTQVAISADKQDMFVTLNLVEGKQYKIADIRLAGDLRVPQEELRKLITVKQGALFNREDINNSIKAVSERLEADGYAFGQRQPGTGDRQGQTNRQPDVLCGSGPPDDRASRQCGWQHPYPRRSDPSRAASAGKRPVQRCGHQAQQGAPGVAGLL